MHLNVVLQMDRDQKKLVKMKFNQAYGADSKTQ